MNLNAAAVVRALNGSSESRHLACLEALGWYRENSEARRSPTTSYVWPITVGGFSTNAGFIQASNDHEVPRAAWHAGFQSGLAALPGELLYVDTERQLQWRVSADQVNAESLRGFTPEEFGRSGRFVPGSSEKLDPLEFPIPDVAASELVGKWLEDQLAVFLRQPQSGELDVDAKRAFVHFAAAILLIRTIEDLEVVGWLPRRAMESAAGQGRVGELLNRAAKDLNSRVLTDYGKSVLSAKTFVSSMIRSSYSGEMGAIDFAALEVDPVGDFFQRLLGQQHSREDRAQLDLLDRSVEVRTDSTRRRKTGSYYTPRVYADALARRLVAPELRLARTKDELPTILDLAAGSGELLCAALREMVSLPRWRNVESVHAMLSQRMYAVDKQETALQLCSLNLLRTAIRAVPEMLTCGKKLPAFGTHFVVDNALKQTVAAQLPVADVTLLNPPFAMDKTWRRQLKDPSEAIKEVGRPGNLAMAFLATAVLKTRAGGSIGAVLPSNQFGTTEAAPWRRWTAERVSIETVVANFASVFPGVQSYAGFLLGRRLGDGVRRGPRTQLIRIDARVDFSSFDAGAMLGSTEHPQVTKQLRQALTPESPSWELQRPGHAHAVLGSHRVRLADVTAGLPHQGVLPAPEPWRRELFLFDRIGTNRVKHQATGEIVDGVDSEFFRPAGWPRGLVGRVPVWCEPVCRSAVVFYPGDSDFGLDSKQIGSQNPAVTKAVRLIVGCVLRANPTSREGRAFREKFDSGVVGYRLMRGYRTSAKPFVFLAQATRSDVGQARGIAASAWINRDGGIVPIGGIHVRFPSYETACLFASWMSLAEVTQVLSAPGQTRNAGTFRLSPRRLSELLIPDPATNRVMRGGEELAEMIDAYRTSAEGLAEAEACQLAVFHEIQRLSRSLWVE